MSKRREGGGIPLRISEKKGYTIVQRDETKGVKTRNVVPDARREKNRTEARASRRSRHWVMMS